MDTQVRTPHGIFLQPQRLLVPLFQRPYVWTRERQWEPLWQDLVRVAQRSMDSPLDSQPHFLGAIVLQQQQSQTSDLQQRTVIDGQQRLTTLQIMIDAIHAEILQRSQKMSAERLAMLIENPEAYRKLEEDRYKVWPTNRDRAAFNEVMAAPVPVDYEGLEHKRHRLVQAHRFFALECREWLFLDGEDGVSRRAEHLERAARELLQLVVIDLAAAENAQEIFETLNARGTPLTAADLIKNYIFQKLLEEHADVEKAYQVHWKHFETPFWEKEIRIGRFTTPRSAAFLTHWLVAKTAEEIAAKEVFSRFKVYAEFEAEQSMNELLGDIHRASLTYEGFVKAASVAEGDIDRLGLFVYRTQTMETESVKPVLLSLLRHPGGAQRRDDFSATLDVIESWLVRRMLVRETTKSYGTVMANLVQLVRSSEISEIRSRVERFFSGQGSSSSYWPEDGEVRASLETLPIYRRLSRGRLRMLLEAVEDNKRGWDGGKLSLAGMRIKRNAYHIEHLMPQSWHASWPLPEGADEYERDLRVHRLGNLTLLTSSLNSKVSNGPWEGKTGKLKENDVLLLNSELVHNYLSYWDENAVDARTDSLIETILCIWKVPEGHQVLLTDRKAGVSTYVSVKNLITAGLVAEGQTLYSRPGKFGGRTAHVLSDGSIDWDGRRYTSLSAAASAVRKKNTNGWGFWRVDPDGEKRLRDVRDDYTEKLREGSDADASS